MQEIKLSPEELEKYRRRETIAHDDATASCTKAGWKTRPHGVIRKLPPEVPNGKFWVATLAEDDAKYINIECERWVDARAFAVLASGGREVKVRSMIILVGSRVDAKSEGLFNRWRVRWEGRGGSESDAARLVARRPNEKRYTPVREIVFE